MVAQSEKILSVAHVITQQDRYKLIDEPDVTRPTRLSKMELQRVKRRAVKVNRLHRVKTNRAMSQPLNRLAVPNNVKELQSRARTSKLIKRGLPGKLARTRRQVSHKKVVNKMLQTSQMVRKLWVICLYKLKILQIQLAKQTAKSLKARSLGQRKVESSASVTRRRRETKKLVVRRTLRVGTTQNSLRQTPSSDVMIFSQEQSMSHTFLR